MTTSVNFEIAKLLKEKSFNKKCSSAYIKKENQDLFFTPAYTGITNGIEYLAPTIADVVMWLYEKHGIWVGVELIDNTLEFYFQPTIWTCKDRDYNDENMIDQAKSVCKWKEWKYFSPIKAYEIAFEYILTNLI